MTRVAPIVAIALLLLVPGVVAAQENATGTATPGPTAPDGEMIDQNTVLVSIEYDKADAEAEVTLYSETLQQVTVTDGGSVWAATDTNQRTVTMRPDTERTISISATEYNGFAGVSIQTSQTLLGKLLKEDTDLIPGGPSSTDSLVVGGSVFALFAVCLPGSVYVLNNYRGGEHREL